MTDKIYELYKKEDVRFIRSFCLGDGDIKNKCEELADIIGIDENLDENARCELAGLFYDFLSQDSEKNLDYMF